MTKDAGMPTETGEAGAAGATGEKPGSNWWLMGIMGILLMGPAPLFIYHYLDQKERQGGTIRMNWIAVLAYDLFGKTVLTWLIAIVGLVVFLAGVLEFGDWRRARGRSA